MEEEIQFIVFVLQRIISEMIFASSFHHPRWTRWGTSKLQFPGIPHELPWSLYWDQALSHENFFQSYFLNEVLEKDVLTMWLYSPVGRLHEVLTRCRGGFKIIVWLSTTGTILNNFILKNPCPEVLILTLPDGAVRAWAMPGEELGGLPGQCTIRPPPPVIVSRPPSPPSPMVSDDSESLRQIHKRRSFMPCSSVSLEMRYNEARVKC